MDNTITFTKDGIKVRETVSNPLIPNTERQSIVTYDKITEYNPLDIHVVGIVPRVVDGTLKEIEFRLGDESDVSFHDLVWFKSKVPEILADGKEWKKESIYKKLEPQFNPSDYKRLKSGGARGYANLTTALNMLKKEDVLENPRKGMWKLRK